MDAFIVALARLVDSEPVVVGGLDSETVGQLIEKVLAQLQPNPK